MFFSFLLFLPIPFHLLTHFHHHHVHLSSFVLKHKQNSSRTREICVNDFECESDNENRGCPAARHHQKPQQQQHKSADQVVTMKMTAINGKKDSPILPDEDLVKTFGKLDKQDVELTTSRNGGHYELVRIGKTSSEPSLKYNSTNSSVSSSTAAATKPKECSPWCRNSNINNNGDKAVSESLTNVAINNNNNNGSGAADAASTNFYILRTRTQTKSLSTRISSLKRESKTTRTLSIVMFTFIACWLPFFILYLLVRINFI